MKRHTQFLGLFIFVFLASALTLASDTPVMKPYESKAKITVIGIQWADPNAPLSGATSTFEGRCSEESDYVITFGIVGEATHLGHFTGTAQHCSQLHLTPAGPGEVTYSDGQFTETAANGDLLQGTYTNGTSGADANGVLWFHDFFTITGGTGRFLNATGSGEEGGSFSDFIALLNGAPAPMWMKGTIAYKASDRR